MIEEATRFQVLHDGVPLKTFPRTVHQDVTRYKAYQAKGPDRTACQGSAEPHL